MLYELQIIAQELAIQFFGQNNLTVRNFMMCVTVDITTLHRK